MNDIMICIIASIIALLVASPIGWFVIHTPAWYIFGGQPALLLIAFAIEERQAIKRVLSRRKTEGASE